MNFEELHDKAKEYIKETLESLVGRRFTKEKLETYLTEKFRVNQSLDDISRDDDELCDFNLLGHLGNIITNQGNEVEIYVYYDIYFLKMRRPGFDGSDILITEVAYEFEDENI